MFAHAQANDDVRRRPDQNDQRAFDEGDETRGFIGDERLTKRGHGREDNIEKRDDLLDRLCKIFRLDQYELEDIIGLLTTSHADLHLFLSVLERCNIDHA